MSLASVSVFRLMNNHNVFSKGTLLLRSCKSFHTLRGNILNEVRVKRNFELCVNQFRLATTLSKPPTPLSAVQSPKKRVPRKKKIDSVEQLLTNNNVFAYATADEYDMERLREGLLKSSPYVPTDIEDFHRSDLLYTETCTDYPENEYERRQIYFFQEGAVVLWNIPEDECMQILKFVKQYELSSYDSSLVLNEQEVMPYSYSEGGKNSDLINGQIVIARDKGNVAAALDRYTFSNAMVLSVKLGIWEGILERYIASVELLTDDLKSGDKIRISREEVLKKTGELFALRHSINLSSDVLDIPDFYWDREDLEKLYITMCNYFSISRRTKVVNEKLNHCLELLDLISSHLNDNHHVRLEWMIIILIMVEVSIATIHLFIF